jgi:hypothetical protein
MTRAVVAVLLIMTIGGAIEGACADRSSSPPAMQAARSDGGQDDAAADHPAPADVEADAAPAAGEDAGTSEGGRDDAGATDGSPCAALCAKVGGAGCSEAQPCLSMCMTTLTESCGDVYRAWAQCAAQQPADRFHCDSRNQGALDTALCAEELRAFGDCLLFGR